MVPVRIAFIPSRSPISRAIAGVTGVPSGLPKNLTLCSRCCWLTMLITGDCSSSICSAWFSVVSKTGSPVWLTKSARMIESLVALGAVPAAPSPLALSAAPPAAGVATGRYFHHARPPASSSNTHSGRRPIAHFRARRCHFRLGGWTAASRLSRSSRSCSAVA